MMQRDPGVGVARTSWDRHEVDAFVAMAVERRYRSGDAIIRQGDPTSVHLIMRGWAKVLTTRLSGHEVLLVLQGPGDLTGHWEAVRGPLSPAISTVIALEPTVTMSVAADRFVEFLLASPHACLAELRNLVNVTVGVEKRRVDLAVVHTGQRLAALLIDLAVRHGRNTPDGIEIGIALSQEEISGMIGASRDSVTRALTSMRAQGLVVTGRRSMTVRDLEALRIYAASERAVN
jgi:CRP-like cAMP-binding protein